MSYKALYRIWRPKDFSQMVGQEHVTKVLKNQIESDHTGHAYLFCGTRGTGKTSAAKIFAKGVNCLSTENNKPCCKCDNCLSIQDERFMDIIEMDAASNNGVDNIRELKESIKYPPAKGKYKVYIIDEVHMLSTGAFNALLKTLEEPPTYIIFILATTEPHKLPATILSRCQRFDFRRVSEIEMASRMKYICEQINVNIDDDALMIIARNSDGSVRDALSVLDQCTSLGSDTVTRNDVIDILGTVSLDFLFEITESVLDEDAESAVKTIERLTSEGKDIQQFLKDWIYHYRNLLITKISNNLEAIISMSSENIARLKKQGSRTDIAAIKNAIMELSKTANEAKWSSQPRIMLELVAIRLCLPEAEMNYDGLNRRISKIEKSISEQGGIIVKNIPSDTVETKNEPETTQEEKAEYTTNKKIENKITNTENTDSSKKYKGSLKKKWNEIIESARMQRPSFNMLSQGVGIKSYENSIMTIIVDSTSKKQIVEMNMSFLETLISDIEGVRTKVEISEGEKQEIKDFEKGYDNDNIIEEINNNFQLGELNIIEE